MLSSGVICYATKCGLYEHPRLSKILSAVTMQTKAADQYLLRSLETMCRMCALTPTGGGTKLSQ